jgi:rhodanese-related sulfurtransferase
MNTKSALSIVMAAGLAAAGCHSMRGHDRPGGGKCTHCGTTSEKACTHCGMPKGHCRCRAKATPMAEINASALRTLIDSGVALTLVDARTGKYDDGRRIAKAINLSPEAKDADIESALPSKDALIVTYCANVKCQASRMLAARLMALGYKRILEYPQGIEGWLGDGDPATPVLK